jgi:hypothetical protein
MSTNTSLEISVAILTSLFQLRGNLRVFGGDLQGFLEDEQRPTLGVFDCNTLGIAAANPAAIMQQGAMITPKRQCQVIALEGAVPNDAILLPPREEPLVAYTSHYAIMGKFRLAANLRVNDFVETAATTFIAVSEAHVFPLFEARDGIIGDADTLMINRHAIVCYHKG